MSERELLCLEDWPPLCGKPATHIVGGGFGSYLACERCAEAWAKELTTKLTPRSRALILLGVELAESGWLEQAERDREMPNPERDSNHAWRARLVNVR